MGLVGHSHAGHLHHHHHGHVHSDNTGRVLSWSLALTIGFVLLEAVEQTGSGGGTSKDTIGLVNRIHGAMPPYTSRHVAET